MSYYFFAISDNKIKRIDNGAKISALEYQHYKEPNQKEEIYYKLLSGNVYGIICNAITKDAAIKAVEKFLLTPPDR